MAGFITFNAVALGCDYRFSTFLLWLQSVQIPPHLFSGAKVTIFLKMQDRFSNYFLILV